MLQKTHSAAGLVAAELVLSMHHVPFLSWEAAGALLAGCLAGPLADIDKPGSTMAKLLFPLSALLRFLGVHHRTMTHSILFILVLMVLALPLQPVLFWSVVCAYASHPLIDLLNEQGVSLLWPYKKKFRLLPKPMAVDTGSAVETAFRWLLLAAVLWIPLSSVLL